MDDDRVWNATEGNSDNAEVSTMEMGPEREHSARAASCPADMIEDDDRSCGKHAMDPEAENESEEGTSHLTDDGRAETRTTCATCF